MSVPPGPKESGSNFFVRTFLVLLALTIGTSGILMFIGYSFSRSSIEKRTIENISQQIDVIHHEFDAHFRANLHKSLKALANDPMMDEFLRGSVAEKLIIRRKLESKFRQVLQDNTAYHHISFMDADGKLAISVMRSYRGAGSLTSEFDELPLAIPTMQLFRELEITPLLLSSGNLEWFMLPREIKVKGPFVVHDGSIQGIAGIAKLDLDTGGFGGMVVIHQIYDGFLAELRSVKFFDENPLWVFSPSGDVLRKPEGDTTPFSLAKALPDRLQVETLLQIQPEGVAAFRDFSVVPGETFFRLMIELPRSLLLKDLRPAVQFFTAVLVISVIVLLFLSLSISRFLSQPFVSLKKTEARLANAQRIARLGHWEYRPATQTVTLSEQAQKILAVSEPCATIKMSDFIERIDTNDRDHFRKQIRKAIDGTKSFGLETGLQLADGEQRTVRHEIVSEYDLAGRSTRILGIIQDISERKEHEEKIRHLAYYDAITGLPNRTLLNEVGKALLASNAGQDRFVAILFMDLDHFKKVNDTGGHSVGDELLRQVSRRLRRCLRQSDSISIQAPTNFDENTVARLGGDEFIVLLTGLHKPADAGIVARRINEAISKRFIVFGKEIYTTCSIGISVCPRDGESTEELLKHADSAMYQAKNSGRNQYKFYSAAIDQKIQSRLSLETQLHRAVNNREFRLVYQPRINISTGRTVSIEALVRWAHPEQGIIAPGKFISVAEETGLIKPIGEFVLENACKQVKAWHESGFADVNISVNISAAQFDRGLIDAVDSILAETGLDAPYLELELTESLLMENIEVATDMLAELKKMGVTMSIDDFGKGYSSLSMLKHLPVDTLKIDKSFTLDLLTDPGDALIVKSTIELGHNLNLTVVAEGVEQTGQLEFLRQHGCDQAQGFLISKPLWPQEFSRWFYRKAS